MVVSRNFCPKCTVVVTRMNSQRDCSILMARFGMFFCFDMAGWQIFNRSGCDGTATTAFETGCGMLIDLCIPVGSVGSDAVQDIQWRA